MMDEKLLKNLPVGSKIWFSNERCGYTIRSKAGRYLVCTKPFNLMDTVLYTIINSNEGIRGTENLVFGMGAETDEDCSEMANRIGKETEISHRNRVPLRIEKILIK